MSVKETVLQWIEKMPDDSAELRDLYERLRLEIGIEEARQSIREGRSFTLEQVEQMTEEKWAKRHSA
jgi:hypothetical protein